MIKLDDNYSIEGDKYNWTLRFEKTGDINPKTGKPTVSKDEWYFSKLEQCLSEYANQKSKEAERYTELADLLKAINTTIKSITK